MEGIDTENVFENDTSIVSAEPRNSDENETSTVETTVEEPVPVDEANEQHNEDTENETVVSNENQTPDETNDTHEKLDSETSKQDETVDQTDAGNKTNESDTNEQKNDKIKSRELKSLIAAAKESNLDTNIAHKRKSLPEQHAQINNRRNSNSSVKSDKELTPTGTKRNMRSQNPEFVAKHQKFISKVTAELDMEEYISAKKDKDSSMLKRKRESIGSASPMDEKKARKLIKLENTCPPKPGQDLFCWQCHKEGVQIQCVACPRSFHLRCLRHAMPICENWTCSECMMIIQAENPETRSYARMKLNDEQFTQVLKFALKRMISVSGSEPFMTPVDTDELEDYGNYIVRPMDLTQLRANIDNGVYKSTEAFTADAKWILHNSMVYNSSQSKLTSVAKGIVKTCKIEMAEIETCPECYINANTHKYTWFIEVCSKPHILVWAKLKGFPFWPAKAVNSNDTGMVDVRFFGAHDKAWVPVKDVFLYSAKDPNTLNKHQKNNIAESLKEVELHIEKLKEKFGTFIPAPLRTPFEPENEQNQLKMLLPNYRVPACDTELEFIPKNVIYRKNARKYISRKMIKEFTDEKRRIQVHSKNGTESNDARTVNVSNANESMDYEMLEGGYGTEEEDSPNNSETGKKLSKFIGTPSVTDEEKESDKSDSEMGSMEYQTTDTGEKKIKTSSIETIRGKVRTRGGYPNVTGKLRIISSGDIKSLKLVKKLNTYKIDLFNKPDTTKLPRRDSDVSSKSGKSDVSRVSTDKINKVEFSETTEITLARNAASDDQDKQRLEEKTEIVTKLKPVIQVNPTELINTNTEIRISPQSKAPQVPSGTIEQIVKKVPDANVDKNTSSTSVNKNTSSTNVIKNNSNNLLSSKPNKENSEKPPNSEAKIKTYLERKTSTVEKQNTKKPSETLTNKSSKPLSGNTKVDDLSPTSSTPSSSSSSNKSFPVDPDPSRGIDSDYEPDTDSEEELSDFGTEESSALRKRSTRIKSNNSKVTLVDVKKIILGNNENKNSTQETKENKDDKKQPKKSDVEEKEKLKVKSDDKLLSKEAKARQEKVEQIENKTTTPQTAAPKESPITLDPNIDIKEEVLDSDEEAMNAEANKREFFPALNLSPNVTLSVIDKQLKRKNLENLATTPNDEKKKTVTKPRSDNVLKTIETVVKGSEANLSVPKKTELKVISVAEINQKKQHSLEKPPATVNNTTNTNNTNTTNTTNNTSTKQKARKSFPNKPNPYVAPTTPTVVTNNKKINKSTYASKIENLNSATKTPDNTNKTFDSNKDKMVYIPHSQSSAVTILPPNISFNTVAGTTKFIVPQNLFTGLTTQTGTTTKTIPLVPISTVQTTVATTSVTIQSQQSRGSSFQTEEERNNAEGLPPLRPRPGGGPLNRDNLDAPTPSTVGPVSQLLNRSAQQMADYFRSIILETLSDISNMGNLEGKVKELQLELEAQKHKHQEEIAALKFEIATLKQTQITEKQRIIQETRQACEQDRIRAVEEAKSKQWCAMCLKESQYRCCWSTSYCSYACQRNHWPQHQTKCQQGVERLNNVNNEHSLNSQNETTDVPASSPVIKQVKNTYSSITKHKQPQQVTAKSVIPKTTGKINLITSKTSSSPGVPTLTFVQNSSGGIELVNHGPIALGGKLIPTSQFSSKIKGYFVSSNAVTTLSPSSAPGLTSFSNKSITIGGTSSAAPSSGVVASQNTTNKTQITTSSSSSTTTTDEHNDVMEVDNEPL